MTMQRGNFRHRSKVVSLLTRHVPMISLDTFSFTASPSVSDSVGIMFAWYLQQVLRVIWEERVANAPLVAMVCLKFTPKTASSPSTIITPSNTPIPSRTSLTTPNGIRIQSAVLSQYTFRTHTHRETDGLGDRSVSAPLAMLIESDALKIGITSDRRTACRQRESVMDSHLLHSVSK